MPISVKELGEQPSLPPKHDHEPKSPLHQFLGIWHKFLTTITLHLAQLNTADETPSTEED